MAESSLILRATVDSVDLESGLVRIRNDMKLTQVEAEKSNASFSGLSSTMSGLGSALVGIGTTGVAALTGLATNSPAVADELANIDQEMRKLSFTAGSIMEPAFDAFANNLLPRLNEQLSNTDAPLRRFLDTMVNGFTNLANLDISSILGGLAGAAGFGGLAALAGAGPLVIIGSVVLGGLAVSNAVNTPYDEPNSSPFSPQIGLPNAGLSFPMLGKLIEDVVRWITGKEFLELLPGAQYKGAI